MDLKDHAELALASLNAATENGRLKVEFSWESHYLHTGGSLSSRGGGLVTGARLLPRLGGSVEPPTSSGRASCSPGLGGPAVSV